MKPVKAFVVASVLAVAFSNASALSTFTWNPAGSGLPRTSFTADDIVVSSFATVTFTSGTTFHEEGYLKVLSFQLDGNDIVAGGSTALTACSSTSPPTASSTGRSVR